MRIVLINRAGHEVKILCPAEGIRNGETETTYRIGSVSIAKLYKGARVAVRIHGSGLDSVVQWKPDIIHSQSEFTSFFIAKRIAAAVHCPIVHTYHTVYEDYTHYFSPSIAFGRKAVIALTRRLLSHVNAIIAPTEKIRTMLYGYGVEKLVSVIPTGLALDKFSINPSEEELNELKLSLGIPLEAKVLITVGRAAKEKNIDELIESFKKLNAGNTYLLIVGGGPYLETLKEEAADCDKIVFTGLVDPQKVPMYYKLGDIFLSASQSETQGLTYIEALASGLPAVCRRDKCLDGVITDGENGAQFDDYESFRDYVTLLLENDELRKQMAENAELSVQRFSSETFAKSVSELYENVLKSYNERIIDVV